MSSGFSHPRIEWDLGLSLECDGPGKSASQIQAGLRVSPEWELTGPHHHMVSAGHHWSSLTSLAEMDLPEG